MLPSPPFKIHDLNGTVIVVRDGRSRTVGWFYYGDGGAEAISAGKMTREEAVEVAKVLVRGLRDQASQ